MATIETFLPAENWPSNRMESRELSQNRYLPKRKSCSDAMKSVGINYLSPFVFAYVVVITTSATRIGGLVGVTTAFTETVHSYSHGIKSNCFPDAFIRLRRNDIDYKRYIRRNSHDFICEQMNRITLYADSNGINNNNPQARSTSKKISREIEIRQQIRALKQQGRISKTSSTNPDDTYREKIQKKLGRAKSKYLGLSTDEEYDDTDEVDDEEMILASATKMEITPDRKGRIGALPNREQSEEAIIAPQGYQRQTDTMEENNDRNDDADMNSAVGRDNDDDYENDEELSEEDLVDLVAELLKDSTNRVTFSSSVSENSDTSNIQPEESTAAAATSTTTVTRTTTGVGGSWDSAATSDATQDIYQPKTGSWGAFPRPRDISKAYGGGRRVGVGYTAEGDTDADETRRRLQRYRATVGIDVESEKVNAQEIEDAMKVAAYAMQRGVYTSAVSALEKVTKFCSTNSKVGGKVFLELAMAYEAAGQTPEAITVYTTLTRSRNEEVASTAKRLLYGIEAIKFMQDNVGSAEFSRKQAKMTFIDTTGLDNFARNFDDVYETAYIDLNNNYYKQLTEAVVRTSREARQILIRASTAQRDGGENISRLRIVQALRSLSRYFDDALQEEIDSMKPLPEPVAVIDGKPIIQPERRRQLLSSDYRTTTSSQQYDEYVLMDPLQMMENLNGEWQLQFLTDKRGDGVKFFNNNTSLVWQKLVTDRNDDSNKVSNDNMKFTSYCSQGILTVEPNGLLDFNNKRRILRRRSIEMTGAGSMITNIFGWNTFSKLGPVGAICTERQIIMVDSILLVTRGVPNMISTTKFGTTITTRSTRKEDEKDYFAVWRRVQPGTYSRN
jgi:hypothetical protein